MDDPNNSTVGLVTSREWKLEHLVTSGPRFRTTDRISAISRTPEEIASTIKEYENRNLPLIVEDLHHHPDWPEFLTPQWLESHYESQTVQVRSVHGKRLDKESSVTELIDGLRNAPPFAGQGEHEQMYGRYMDCPREWRTWIKTSRVLPDVVIPGSTGDVLPETVETSMSHLGASDASTPLHKGPCASYGQNIMCYTEDDGSSFWFMTGPMDCGAVANYFRGLGHELCWEDHVATLEELAKAPFDVYVLEQKLGDLVLIPPRSFHQVVNTKGLTIKTSWSRMSIRSLEIALYHELPVYRRVCRSEIFRVKRTIYDTLVQRTTTLNTLVNNTPDSTLNSVNPLCKEIARLISLLDDVLEQEYSTQHRRLRQVTSNFAPDGRGHPCDFCGADIFLSSFRCDSCTSRGDSGDPICLCPTCVVEGRACECGSMVPVQSGSFRELLRNRNSAMIRLRQAREAGFYEDEPEELSDQHLIESVTTTFQAACLLAEKRRDILNTQKAIRTCTIRKNGQSQSHVVDGWAIIMCKDCHAGKCFVHILEAGIHSSVALMTVDHDKTYGKWHSSHTNRQKRYESAVPTLIWSTRMGDPTTIADRLVYFARSFQTPRPLSEQVSLGFYDKKLPDPEEVDQLDPIPVENPAAPPTADVPSRKRKRSSKPPNPKAEHDRPSQQPADDLASGRLSHSPQSSKRLWMDCVLITTLPPASRRKAAPPETSGDEDQSSQARKKAREKRRGKRREGASVRSDSQSLVVQSMHSRSHSVSSLRPPLFEPETTPPLDQTDSDQIEVEESSVQEDSDEVDDSDRGVLSFLSYRRKRIESDSPISPVGLPPPSSSSRSLQPDKLPYYTIVRTKQRPPGSEPRRAPHQHQLAKNPRSIYDWSQTRQLAAGPSHPNTRVGPPKHRLPERPGPKVRPAAELPPPRPPPPPPGLAALETRMGTYEAKMNAFADENQKLRDELTTVKGELVAAREELTAALARIDTTKHSLHGLEALDSRVDGMKEDYDKLSNLLRGDNLFNTEKFHTAVQSEVKSNFGYYWPSAKTDMKNQLWKELPPSVKDHMDKEIGKLSDEMALIRSELVAFQQKSIAGGIIQNGDPAVAQLKQAIELIQTKQEELEKTLHNSALDAQRSTPTNTGNMPPPILPRKSPPWVDDPQQGPQQRGAETSPVAPDQNSYPSHQGPGDEVNNPLRAGPTQDPRRSAAPPRSSSTFPLTPTRSPRPGPISPQSTTFHIVYEQSSPLTSAPPIPTLPRPFHGMHPSRFTRLETDAFSPFTTKDSEPPVIATLTPRPQPNTPPTTRPENIPSIPIQPLAGMHPDRIAFLTDPNQLSSAVTSTPFSPHASLNGSQQRPVPVYHSRSLPTFLSGTNVTVPPRDGPIPSSSRLTLDDVATPTTPGFPHFSPFTTSSNSVNQHTPTQTHGNPNQSPNRGKNGSGTRKRRPSETLKSKRKRKRLEKKNGKTNLNKQPGLSKFPRAEDDGNLGSAYEDGDVHGG